MISSLASCPTSPYHRGMDRTSRIDRIARRLAGALPPGGEQLRTDLEQNARVILGNALQRMELVTREEFDIQRKVLQRLQGRIGELEERVRQLEGDDQA